MRSKCTWVGGAACPVRRVQVSRAASVIGQQEMHGAPLSSSRLTPVEATRHAAALVGSLGSGRQPIVHYFTRWATSIYKSLNDHYNHSTTPPGDQLL